ncbi:MAG: retropepsin-like domain-containing protein [Candidatus Eremiobacteraeota bacterium]|nr:retropepsin-like domain-containing protein [Candidatus Eremiobacteraeota bacterium]
MRFAVRLLALAAALCGLAAAPAPDPLAALADANGHPAALHLLATGTRVLEGRTVVTTLDQLGTRRLLRRCIAGVCGGTWFDGTTQFTFGLNEIALPEESDATVLTERTLAAIASYAFAEPAFRSSGGTVVAAGPGRWRVRAHDGIDLIAVVDPAAHALRRVETPEGRLVATYARETKAGGASFALDRNGPFEAGPLDAVAVSTDPLGPPAGPVPALAGDPAVPLDSEPVPIVPCGLGGHNLRCLLDTGATPSAITLSVAETLNLEPHGELEISGIGSFATGFVEAGPLQLGPARFASARFAVIPPSSAAPFDVVVGSDLLARMRLVLDHAHHVARILPSGGSAPADAVHLTFRAGSPIVQTMFGPQGARALLDTGDQAVLSFGYAAYREGPQWAIVGRGQALGVGGGADDAFTVEIPEVHVGPVTVGKTRATVRRTQSVAHVGVGLWDRFLVDLDEAAGRLTLTTR